MSILFRIYVKEMRCLFRDWHILLYSVALPAVLYPVLFVSAFQVITYIRGIEEIDRPLRRIDLKIKFETSAEPDQVELLRSRLRRRCAVSVIFREAGIDVNETWEVTHV